MLKVHKIIVISILLLFAINDAVFSYNDDDLIEFFIFDASYSYTHWKPTGITGVDYDTTGLNALQLSIDLRPMRKKSLFFYFAPKIDYLFTPENKADQELLLKKSYDGDNKVLNALERLWVDVPLFESRHDDISYYVYFLYDQSNFLYNLKLLEDKTYLTFNEQEFQFYNGDSLNGLTHFEKYQLGLDLEFNHIIVGLALYYQKYKKPYSVVIEGSDLKSLITDTKFSSRDGFLYKIGFQTDPINEAYNLKFLCTVLLGGEGKIEFTDSSNMKDTYLSSNEKILLRNLKLELKGRFNLNALTSLLPRNSFITFNLGYESYKYDRGIEVDGYIEKNPVNGTSALNKDEIFSGYLGFNISM